MKSKTTTIIISLIIIAIAAYVLIMYNQLPDKIPMHWNMQGEVDSYGSKIAIFNFLGLLLGINVLMPIAKFIDPKRANYQRFLGVYNIFRLILTALFASLIIIVIQESINPGSIDVSKAVSISICLLFIIIGNYLPKIKHNYTFGIKLPWTLNDEDNWQKTHRLAGVVWVVCSTIALFLAIILNSSIFYPIFMAIVAILVIVPGVYSYYLYFQKNK